jgi:hypothetical protein
MNIFFFNSIRQLLQLASVNFYFNEAKKLWLKYRRYNPVKDSRTRLSNFRSSGAIDLCRYPYAWFISQHPLRWVGRIHTLHHFDSHMYDHKNYYVNDFSV